MALAKPLTAPASEPTVLERLHADRTGLAQSLDDLNRSAARLHETNNAEAAVLAEIGAMGSAEIAAMTAWASAGVGDPPSPDQKQRRALAEKLATAQAAATAARGATADIDARIIQQTGRLALINDEIEIAIFNQIEHEHSDVIAEFAKVCEIGSRLATRISGLALLFRETGNNQRANVILATRLPVVSTNPSEVQSAADVWGRRAADLRSGK
jgi:hypothetical protein